MMIFFSVEDHGRHRTSHISSFRPTCRPTSPTLSSTSGSGKSCNEDNGAICPSRPLAISCKDARKIVADAQKTLQSITLIDLHSIQGDEFRDFWIEFVRVIKGLHERIGLAGAVLQLSSDTQTCI
jgi:hypothetical protein